MWKHRIGYVAVVSAVLASYLVSDRREALAMLVLFILVPLLCAGLQYWAIRSFSIQCRVRESCSAGQNILVDMEVNRESRLPMGAVHIKFSFENVLYGDVQDRVLLLQPTEKKQQVFQYPFEAQECGGMKITAAYAQCCDMLGLFCWKKNADIQAAALVYPPDISLHVQIAHRPETKNMGELYDQGRKGQDVNEVSDLRDYVPGDSLHSIHWKLSGKMDKLIVREFGNPSNYNTLVLYELMKYSEGQEIPRQWDNTVLAVISSLSYSLMKMNLEHNVGTGSLGGLQTVPVYSVDTHSQMMRNLLCKPIVGENSSAQTVYSFLRGNTTHMYTKVIYISPVYDEGIIRQLSQEVDLTVIRIVQGGSYAYMDAPGYTVMPLDVEYCRDHVYNVVI